MKAIFSVVMSIKVVMFFGMSQSFAGQGKGCARGKGRQRQTKARRSFIAAQYCTQRARRQSLLRCVPRKFENSEHGYDPQSLFAY